MAWADNAGSWLSSASGCWEFWQPCKVIGRHGLRELRADPAAPAVNGLRRVADGLRSTEGFLDLLTVPLRQDVAGTPGDPPVDGRTPGLLRDVRCHEYAPEFKHDVGAVVFLVRIKRRVELGECWLIISSAALRSPYPSAWVSAACTTKSLRFFISVCPMKHNIAAAPGAFFSRRASGSVTEAWVAFERFSPRKFASASRDWRGVSVIGWVSVCCDWKLVMEAHAFIKVPSTASALPTAAA